MVAELFRGEMQENGADRDPLSVVMYSTEIGRVLEKISFEINGVPS